MKFSPKDVFMNVDWETGTTAGIKRWNPAAQPGLCGTVTYIAYLRGDVIVYTLTAQAHDQKSTAFWLIKAFQ